DNQGWVFAESPPPPQHAPSPWHQSSLLTRAFIGGPAQTPAPNECRVDSICTNVTINHRQVSFHIPTSPSPPTPLWVRRCTLYCASPCMPQLFVQPGESALSPCQKLHSWKSHMQQNQNYRINLIWQKRLRWILPLEKQNFWPPAVESLQK
ncbi:hypothetical protein KUCAC02_023456, partial [Chaenocephalus aceratus]